MDFYGKQLPVFKAALHNHCTVSDGLFEPNDLIKMYADEKFDIFAFTDHRKTNPIANYNACGMTLISGIELHPKGPRETTWHLLALNVPQDFPGEFATAQEAVDKVNAAGGLIYCAHPEWCGITSADIAQIKGFAGIEVYNSSCRYNGKENNESVWNELTDMNINYPALAVDDTHSKAELFGGWTMIAAEDKSLESIMKALKNGQFYATQGPEFTRLSFKDNVFEAEFTEVEEAILIGERNLGYWEVLPGYPAYGDYKLVTSIRKEAGVRTLPDVRRFRCRIKDAKGRYAWTPVVNCELYRA